MPPPPSSFVPRGAARRCSVGGDAGITLPGSRTTVVSTNTASQADRISGVKRPDLGRQTDGPSPSRTWTAAFSLYRPLGSPPLSCLADGSGRPSPITTFGIGAVTAVHTACSHRPRQCQLCGRAVALAGVQLMGHPHLTPTWWVCLFAATACGLCCRRWWWRRCIGAAAASALGPRSPTPLPLPPALPRLTLCTMKGACDGCHCAPAIPLHRLAASAAAALPHNGPAAYAWSADR